MAQANSNFSTDKHGYAFANRFRLPFATQIEFPKVGKIDLPEIIYGLCGGMCFAALDYYYDGRPIPDYRNAEDLPPAYLLYLWERQLDSLGFITIPKLFEWMLRNDQDVALRTARYEVPKLRRRLDQGIPVVLALVRSRGASDPTVNHQVLARGYQFDEASRQLTIHLYDPNYPHARTRLQMDLTRPSQGLQAVQSTGEPLRGLFLIRYRSQRPPVEAGS